MTATVQNQVESVQTQTDMPAPEAKLEPKPSNGKGKGKGKAAESKPCEALEVASVKGVQKGSIAGVVYTSKGEVTGKTKAGKITYAGCDKLSVPKLKDLSDTLTADQKREQVMAAGKELKSVASVLAARASGDESYVVSRISIAEDGSFAPVWKRVAPTSMASKLARLLNCSIAEAEEELRKRKLLPIAQ